MGLGYCFNNLSVLIYWEGKRTAGSHDCLGAKQKLYQSIRTSTRRRSETHLSERSSCARLFRCQQCMLGHVWVWLPGESTHVRICVRKQVQPKETHELLNILYQTENKWRLLLRGDYSGNAYSSPILFVMCSITDMATVALMVWVWGRGYLLVWPMTDGEMVEYMFGDYARLL